MSIVRTGLGLSVLASALLFAPPAAAGRLYCDNDRAAGQYPYCNNISTGGWSYSSGHSGDYNRDSRITWTGGLYYAWDFPSRTRTYSAYAWLANYAFTDPVANYQFGTQGVLRNQNTAPSGWSFITRSRDSRLVVISSGRGGTGADGVQLAWDEGGPQSIADSMAPAAAGQCAMAAVPEPEILAVQRRMLDAADRYQGVHGAFDIRFANNGQRDQVDFEYSRVTGAGLARVRGANGENIEYLSDGRSLLTLHPGEASYRRGRLAPAQLPQEGPRAYRNRQCEPVYVHRSDTAGATVANEVISPQNYAFWLSSGRAQVVGEDVVAGRRATVIEGTHDDYLRAKLGAQGFRMWVDAQTGVLLKLVGSDRKGAEAYAIEVLEIGFDNGRALKVAAQAPAGWRELASP